MFKITLINFLAKSRNFKFYSSVLNKAIFDLKKITEVAAVLFRMTITIPMSWKKKYWKLKKKNKGAPNSFSRISKVRNGNFYSAFHNSYQKSTWNQAVSIIKTAKYFR